MKCALCGKEVRSHKREMILIVNEGVLDVEPSDFKQTMHKRCATHYRVAERLLISSGAVKAKETKKSEVVMPSSRTKYTNVEWAYMLEDKRDQQPKYNIFGKRREW